MTFLLYFWRYQYSLTRKILQASGLEASTEVPQVLNLYLTT